jgi:3,4-dihydroxy-9,10-secoandrosta-1,3,5(10)-triene-9,17-dione 4,5-dioxygenase
VGFKELGYLLIGSQKLDAWRHFGEQVLGMQSTQGPDGTLYLKMDSERDFRFAVVPSDTERLHASGWAVAGPDEYRLVKTKLQQREVEVHESIPQERRLRRVQDFCWFTDPAGNRQEVFWGPISDFKPFISPVGVSSFVTGDLGLGHVVLPAPDIDVSWAFWHDKIGFGLSDLLTMNFGGHPVRLHFTHCGNSRQHSLALAGMPAPTGCVHMMVEVATLSDLGQAMDRVEAHGIKVVLTLGQHVNDDCVSFYFMTPSGFFFEIGWRSILKDWDRHTVFETTLPSHWGHKFVMNDPR